MSPHVLVTGCSSGIGLATATLLADRGVGVYATVRKEPDAERLNAIDGVEAFLCDVTSDSQVETLRAAIDDRETGLYGIVHNAGIAQLGDLTTTTVDALRSVLEVNVIGVHRVTNAFVDRIVESGGRIVTMSSLSGTDSSSKLGAYSMSKHALEAYTDTLANELAPQGVRVVAIVPGNYSSAIVSNAVGRFAPNEGESENVTALWDAAADTSRSRYPTPEPVAEACYAALFDEDPLERYLIVPVAEEADWVLSETVRDWARLNRSSPFTWSAERLQAEIAEAGGFIATADQEG